MSSQDTEGQPRWWRRGRDLSLHAARESRATAAEAMFELDSLQKDLPALMSAHRDAASSRQRQGRASGKPDQVSRDWETVSGVCEEAISKFLELDSSFHRDRDYEELEANRFRDEFDEAARRMRMVIPDVQQFRNLHEDALQGAYNRTLSVPRSIEEAESLLADANRAYERAQSAGLTDVEAVNRYREAKTKLDAARAALSRNEWSTAAREADAAKSVAHDVAERLGGLEEQAQAVQRGYLSVKTRRDALMTKHDRLPPVLSELRRRYTLGSYKHLDDAPARIDAAMTTVEAGLTALGAALDSNPLDVPAADAMLRNVRAAASDVDSVLRSATETLARLDEVSADPETLLVAVRRKTVDARRFLTNLPHEKAQRFSYTFDNISARTDRLVTATKAHHPDWGAVIAEATSIESALDAMIQTARTS